MCEIVAAVSARPGITRLPPLPLAWLRVDGANLPSGDRVSGAPAFSTASGARYGAGPHTPG